MTTAEKLVILGALGEVAQLLATTLKSKCRHKTLIGIDQYEVGPSNVYSGYIAANVSDTKDNEKWTPLLEQANLVIICLPEAAALKAVAAISSCSSTRIDVVDTLSVKSTLHLTLQQNNLHQQKNLRFFGIDPLFRPDLGWHGNNVACVSYDNVIEDHWLVDLLKSEGENLCWTSATNHDIYMSLIHTATHTLTLLFGLLLKQTNYDIKELRPFWTPPHRHLLQLLARVVGGNPEVYRDIQYSNPNSSLIRHEIAKLCAQLELVSQGASEFSNCIDKIKDMLGPKSSMLEVECEKAFSMQQDTIEWPQHDQNSLPLLRQEIDAIDDKLISLLQKRFRISTRVIHYKMANDLPMIQPHRVEGVKRKFVAKAVNQNIPEDFAKTFVEILIGASCEHQNKILEQSGMHPEEVIV